MPLNAAAPQIVAEDTLGAIAVLTALSEGIRPGQGKPQSKELAS